MKALKTIVATAVIVFALTTVAVAGARHVGSWGDAAPPAAAPAPTQTHHTADVTLTDGQFARLLRATNGQAARLRTPQAAPETTRERTRDHDQQEQKADGSAVHTQAQQRTQTHDGGGTHDHGTQGGSTHPAGTHDGGTHHDGSTHHDGGTPHDGGTHHGGTCDE